MKEITRIHIAKIPYEIETAAKKELESYLHALESHGIDAEIVEDIEVRITEILHERGVKKSGVIAVADVKAVKRQLGTPEDFMGDGDIAVGLDEEAASETTRRLYRDTDNAVIGGVLAGIAAFFKINPLWVRLVFILLALASFGTMILVYLVLWLAVPPAKTAADKLRMAGRPVTVSSIRAMNENEATKPARDNSDVRRVVTALAGGACVICALAGAALTAAGTVAFFVHKKEFLDSVEGGSDYFFAAFGLLAASGLLFVTLMILGAYASFAQKLNRRVIISGAVVVILGLAAFGAAIGLAQYGSTLRMQEIQKNTHESSLKLPENARTATSLVAALPGMKIDYIVVDEKAAPYGSTRMFAPYGATLPKVTTALKDGVLTIGSNESADETCNHRRWCGDTIREVTVYGPALQRISAGENTSLKYYAKTQQELIIDAGKKSGVAIESGVINKLQVIANDGSSLSTAEATVTHVSVTVNNASDLEFGSIQSLELADKNSCPANSTARLEVWNISNETVEVNGVNKPAETTNFACTWLYINNKENS